MLSQSISENLQISANGNFIKLNKFSTLSIFFSNRSVFQIELKVHKKFEDILVPDLSNKQQFLYLAMHVKNSFLSTVLEGGSDYFFC